MQANQEAEELKSMVNELMTANASLSEQQYSLRAAAYLSGGYDMADTLHNVYLDYGYPASVNFSHCWNMYRRLGIAATIVDLPPDTCWSTPPVIASSNEAFNRDFESTVKKLKLWQRLKGADKRQRVGRYAGLFVRVRDGKHPKEPIEGKLSGINSVTEIIPLYESQLVVKKTDDDPKSDTFNQPLILEFNQNAIGDRNEKSSSVIEIHRSRIIFLAEGADDGSIYGKSSLETVYNSLMDLRKIAGGGAEGFYKNAAQNILFDLKNPELATTYKDKLDKFSENYDDFSKNRMRRALWTPGMDAKILSSQLISPKDSFDVALSDVAAGAGIPAKILIGAQQGRLAADQDGNQFLANMQSRRENFGSEVVSSVIDWFIKFGVLASADYSVEWDDLLARSDSQKLGNAKEMAETNKLQFDSGGQPVFTDEEIRLAAGHNDPINMDDLPPSEEIDQATLDAMDNPDG